MLPRWASRFVPEKADIIAKSVWMVRWSDARIPRGVRSILGLPLIIGGILSFLPVLGLWMLPAGILLIALDIPRYRHRILAWAAKKEDEAAEAAKAEMNAKAGDPKDANSPELLAPPAQGSAGQSPSSQTPPPAEASASGPARRKSPETAETGR